jgi:WD40 repeat protein
VAWVPNSLVLASASYDNSIKFWSQEDDDWTCIDTIKGHESTVWDIAFSRDGAFMASCSDDLLVKVWAKNEEFEEKDYYCHISTLEGYHDRPIYSCSWNFDGNFLATVSKEYIS